MGFIGIWDSLVFIGGSGGSLGFKVGHWDFLGGSLGLIGGDVTIFIYPLKISSFAQVLIFGPKMSINTFYMFL